MPCYASSSIMPPILYRFLWCITSPYRANMRKQASCLQQRELRFIDRDQTLISIREVVIQFNRAHINHINQKSPKHSINLSFKFHLLKFTSVSQKIPSSILDAKINLLSNFFPISFMVTNGLPNSYKTVARNNSVTGVTTNFL